jgi:hypothetical protein
MKNTTYILMKHSKSTIAKLLTKSNALAPVLITAICLLFPVIAFSQGFRSVALSGRSQSPTSTNPGQISQILTVTNLNDSGAGNLRQTILAANRNTDLNASAGAAEISAAQRGNPFINFENGKTLASESGNLVNAKPLALASADFDADGVPDLAVAYAGENGGFVLIRRGNVESIFPPNADAKPEPFFAESSRFEILLAADHLSAGDFNGDGRADLLAVKNGSNVLIFLAGTGAGDFAAPQAIELKGVVTAFTAGEVNNFDNLADFAVGIIEKGTAKILIFQSEKGAFAAEPQSLKMSKTVSALVFGELDAHPSRDLIAAAGDELVLVSGGAGGKIENKNVSRRKLDFQIAALAVGDFVGERDNEIAILSEDGELKVLSSNFSLLLSSAQTPTKVGTPNSLLSAKVSTRTKTDLIIGGANNLNLITNDGADNLSLAASFDSTENPIAVLPMRLNKDALNDLVVLTENKLEPTILMTAPLDVITVNSDGGTGGGGTLFNAIQTANSTPGLQEIQFNLSGSTQISMQVSLPNITEAITLNGLSQSNPNGEPLVSITSLQNTDATTLNIVGGNSVVRGLVLNCADEEGSPVRLLNVGNNFVESNFIGTNANGTNSAGTLNSGVLIGDSSGNTIGGGVVQARNIISGMSGVSSNGIHLSFASSNNLIKGNYIGTDKTGLAALSNNASGILIETASSGNVIGGATDGERNVISANGFGLIAPTEPASGVRIKLPLNSFSDVVVENNFIGTNKDGDAALGNLGGGVRLEYNASGNPTATAQLFDNVISGNTGDGVFAFNAAAPLLNAVPQGFTSDTLILGRRNSNLNASPEVFPAGNRIGINAAGNATLPNTGNGVNLQNISALVEGNLISANGASGIRITGAASFGNFIADNLIGTNAGGTVALGNQNKGIWIDVSDLPIDPAQTTKIYDNVISGNTGDGVFLSGTMNSLQNAVPQGAISDSPILGRRPPQNLNGAANTVFSPGNRIGTNAAGNAALPNGGNGVNLQNVPALVEDNLISGNAMDGITQKWLSANYPADTESNISGNYIGTDVTGNNDLGNGANGITIERGAITGNVPKTFITASVISGNANNGIEIVQIAAPPFGETGSSMPVNGIMDKPNGLWIGTNAAGTSAIPNGGNGISIRSSNVEVGGATEAERNIISGNLGSGIKIEPNIAGTTLQNIEVKNNYIGTNTAGNAIIPNSQDGLFMTYTGGLASNNLISGNGMSGIRANPPINTSLPFEISENFIGTDASGNVDLGNTGDGITLEYNGTPHIDMKTSDILSNVISGNNGDAIRIFGDIIFGNNAANSSGSKSNAMPQNTTFFASIARQTQGSSKSNLSSKDNVLPRNTTFFANCGRQSTNLSQQSTPGNIPTGNFIGTNAAGTAALPNGGNGVNLQNVPALVEGNLISANGLSGINAKPPIGTSLPFEISDNYIGTDVTGSVDLGNTSDGITLEYNGTLAVDAQSTEILSNVISGNNGDGVKSTGNITFVNNAANSSGSKSNAMPQAMVFLPSIHRQTQGNSKSNVTNKSNVLPRTTSFLPSIGRQTQSNSKSNVTIKSNVLPRNMAFFSSISRQTTNLGQQSTPGNIPTGNFIGTNAAGTAALPNAGNGVNLQNVPALVEGNLISANGMSGINAKPPIGTSLPFEISDNYIGTDVTGNVDLGNTGDGITLEYNGTAHIDAKTSDILSNVISGNNGDGVRIFGNITFDNNAANSSGSKSNAMPRTTSFFAAIGRQTQGSSKSNVSNKSNVMPRNTTFFANIGLQTMPGQQMTTGNLPLGNRIGTNAAGTSALGNAGHGISITNIPSKVGGETFDDGNIIAHNGGNGVNIANIGDQTVRPGSQVLNNLIYSNAGLGIDLGGDGVTLNDLGDADTGANNLQNYPVVTSASSNGSQTSVSGTINTTPNTDLTIQFYATLSSTNAAALPIGGGGGPIGMLNVTSNASGNASFNATFPVGVPAGRLVSATATTDETNVGNENNTSEFSPGVLVFAPTSATVTVSGRILSPQGAGVAKASVTLIAPNGVRRTALASSLGYYRFEDIPVGETYVFSVSSKRFTFAPRVVFVTEEMTVDFTAEP